MNAIQECLLSIDVNRFNTDIENLIFRDVNFSHDDYERIGQISLHAGKDWFDGTGSLYDYMSGEFTRTTSEFNKTNPLLEDSYIGSVIKAVRAFAKNTDVVNIGRIRIMRLKPKTCYTLHQDPEEFRYHIPLYTSSSALFIVDNEVGKMPTTGLLYRFKTNAPHTAVNASFHERVHLVFDTYKDEEC